MYRPRKILVVYRAFLSEDSYRNISDKIEKLFPEDDLTLLILDKFSEEEAIELISQDYCSREDFSLLYEKLAIYSIAFNNLQGQLIRHYLEKFNDIYQFEFIVLLSPEITIIDELHSWEYFKSTISMIEIPINYNTIGGKIIKMKYSDTLYSDSIVVSSPTNILFYLKDRESRESSYWKTGNLPTFKGDYSTRFYKDFPDLMTDAKYNSTLTHVSVAIDKIV